VTDRPGKGRILKWKDICEEVEYEDPTDPINGASFTKVSTPDALNFILFPLVRLIQPANRLRLRTRLRR